MIRLICYDNVSEWIVGKFAEKLHEYLKLFQVDSEIANRGCAGADIAHHLLYGGSPNDTIAPVETLMISHLDTERKVTSVKNKLRNFNMGVCMSGDHLDFLTRVGLPQNRLCYVTPAHDGIIKPRPIVLGYTGKVHDDGRKKEWDLPKALQALPPGAFQLKIMGSGWTRIVDVLRSQGHPVEYYEQFDYDIYVKSFMPSLDYWLYFSHDEGSMGFQDAIAADAKIIATPQGYHLDVLGGIDHVINNMYDLQMTLREIYEERRRRVARVSRWTWAEYAWRHLIIWDFLKNSNSSEVLAEENVFIRLLPQFAQNFSEQLQYELLVRPVPEMEALLHASNLAQKNNLSNLAGHYKRKALVYYPRNDELREDVLAFYPNVKEFVPD